MWSDVIVIPTYLTIIYFTFDSVTYDMHHHKDSRYHLSRSAMLSDVSYFLNISYFTFDSEKNNIITSTQIIA